MERVLRDSAWSLRLELRDTDGVLITNASAVSVAITDAAGVAMTGSPFSATEGSGADDGVWTAALPAASTAQLGVYDVVWTATVAGADQLRRQQIEIVGAFYFDLAEFRTWSADDALADPAQLSGLTLRRARDAVESKFESHCAPSFRPRRRRITLSGDGSSNLVIPDLMPTVLVAASIDDVALTADELDDVALHDFGVLQRRSGSWTRGSRNVVVTYDHGYTSVPDFLREPAMKLARSYLVPSPLPDRSTGQGDANGNYFRLSVAGRDGPTGIPEVDAILDEFGDTVGVTG